MSHIQGSRTKKIYQQAYRKERSRPLLETHSWRGASIDGRSPTAAGSFFPTPRVLRCIASDNSTEDPRGLRVNKQPVPTSFAFISRFSVVCRVFRYENVSVTCTVAEDDTMDNFGLPWDQLPQTEKVDYACPRQLLSWEAEVPHW